MEIENNAMGNMVFGDWDLFILALLLLIPNFLILYFGAMVCL